MTMQHSLKVVAGSLIVLAVGSLGVAQDRVVPIKGATAVGKIEEITPNQVTINVRGKTQPPYPTNEILKIVYDGEPNGLDRARDFINNRQFNQAQDELKKLDLSKVTDQRIRDDIQFYTGYADARLSLSGMGDPVAAARILVAFTKADPQSYHTYKARELLGDLAVLLNHPAPAMEHYGVLKAAPFPELQALYAYKAGEVALTMDKLPEARQQFQQLMSATATDAEVIRLKNLAEVGLAVCDARDGKSQEALSKLQELVKKHDSTDQALFARIYNAQGTCYLALGQPQQALLAYLKTDLLFSASPELHAEALYQLVQLWPQVGQPQRAAEARQRLVANYPASTWTNKN